MVTASFAPDATRESLVAEWIDAATKAPQRTARRHLAARLPERLAERLCEEAGVDPSAQVSQVARERRAALIERVLARDLGVSGTLGYEKAEADSTRSYRLRAVERVGLIGAHCSQQSYRSATASD